MNLFEIDKNSIEKTFDRIAKELMQQYQIVTPSENKYRITELEFYYHSDSHQDPYVHGKHDLRSKEIQSKYGQWFFHWSGIDITIGNGKDAFGGILIRGVKLIRGEKMIDGEYSNGPLTVMMELMSAGDGMMNVFNNNKFPLFLEKLPVLGTNEIKRWSRIGLSAKDGDQNKKEYAEREYRYVTDISENRHKYKDKERLKKYGKVVTI